MSKLVNFNVTTHTYKTVGNHPILVDLYIPRNIAPGPHPVAARIHGGFLVTGSRRLLEWLPKWFIDFAESKSAIVVCPDYRLLPEAKGIEILEDIDDFWTWVHEELPGIVAKQAPGSTVDLNKALVTGESAGGYLSIQLGLRRAKSIRVVISEYPVLDLKARFWTESYEKILFGTPNLPVSILENHLASKTAIVTEGFIDDRGGLTFCILQNGRILDFLGKERELFPEDCLDDGAILPPLFLLHGAEDHAVPVEGSEKFVQKLRDLGKSEVVFSKPPGDHSFDNNASLTADFLQEGLKFITEKWLAE